MTIQTFSLIGDIHFLPVSCFLLYDINQLICYSQGNPCDAEGNDLPPHAPPACPPPTATSSNPWYPFSDRIEFDFANFHFVKCQNSEDKINEALDMWTAQVLATGGQAPWSNAKELYETIDAIQEGDAPWVSYKIRYTGPLPPRAAPQWMTQEYELCARDTRMVLHQQFESAHFKDHVHYTPYQQFNGEGHRVWSNLMSADLSWKQAVSCRFGYTNLTSESLFTLLP